MEIQDFRCFVVLSEVLNFRQAAEVLHMSQPSLTRLIKRIEQEIGVALFNRTTRTVELTQAGQVLLKEAKALLVNVDEAARRIRHATADASHRLRIGYVPFALHIGLPSLLSLCRRDFPEGELDLRERSTDQLVNQLRSAEIDIGFVYTPIHSAFLSVRQIYREPMKLAVAADHPMANQSSASLRAFADDVFILHPRAENTAMYDEILRCCTAAGFSPRTFEQAHDQHCMALLRAGQGVHFIAPDMNCLKSTDERYVAISDKAPMLGLAIAWREKDPSAVIKSLDRELTTYTDGLQS